MSTLRAGENVNSYKVTVNLGSHFSDIDEDDWYYDNVMDAADNGYISGMGDGHLQSHGFHHSRPVRFHDCQRYGLRG